jgi:tetratricopeptide (TPR) repeat protein
VDGRAASKTVEELEKLRHQAHKHLQANEWHEALTAFNSLLLDNQEDVDALLGLALALDRLGDYQKMYEIARSAAKIDPSSALALACQARALQKLERISEATIANDQALLLDTNLALAWFNRCGQQLIQNHAEEALRYADRAIELDPGDARTWCNKALALARMNRMYEALGVVNQSLALDPDFLLALETKGEILRSYARFEEVIVTMDHALELAPDDVSALNLMANALRITGQFDRLLETTQRLMPLAPDSPLACDLHISALRGTSSFEEANEVIDHILEFEPTNVRYWMFKADNLYRLQRYREAVSVSEQALKIDDEYPPARRIHEKAMRMMYQQKRKK